MKHEQYQNLQNNYHLKSILIVKCSLILHNLFYFYLIISFQSITNRLKLVSELAKLASIASSSSYYEDRDRQQDQTNRIDR